MAILCRCAPGPIAWSARRWTLFRRWRWLCAATIHTRGAYSMTGRRNALYTVIQPAGVSMWAALFRTQSHWRVRVATERRWSLKGNLASTFTPRRVMVVVSGTSVPRKRSGYKTPERNPTVQSFCPLPVFLWNSGMTAFACNTLLLVFCNDRARFSGFVNDRRFHELLRARPIHTEAANDGIAPHYR